MNPKYTMEQYENLKESYASGVLSVSYAGQSTVYRSMQEMREMLAEMEAALGIDLPNQNRGPLSNIVRGIYNKGL